MSTPVPPPAPKERRRSFQFSLATLMGVMTLVAVGLTVMLAMPNWVGMLVLAVAQVGFVAFLVAGALFAQGNSKTFCIGAIATQFLTQGVAAQHWLMGTSSTQISGATVNVAVNFLAVLLGGWVCVRARRYWEQHNR